MYVTVSTEVAEYISGWEGAMEMPRLDEGGDI